jgi:hypothetical protein
MRTPTRFAAYALLVLSGVSCIDGPTTLNGRGGLAMLNLAPVFSLQAERAAPDLSAFSLTVDNVHVRVNHPPAERLDTVVAVPAGADSVVLDLPVVLGAPTEQLLIRVELRQGNRVLYGGTQVVTASVGATAGAPPITIPIDYEGPGANLRRFSIAPHDTTILASGTVPFRVTAADSGGAVAVGLPIDWIVTNSALGAVDQSSGVFTPSGSPGTTFVIAATPNGLRDSALVTVVALP